MPAFRHFATSRDEGDTQTAPPGEWIRRYAVTVAFWSAVGLPLVYIPAIGGGLVAPAAALIGMHAIALVGGRNYARPCSSPPDGTDRHDSPGPVSRTGQ